MANTLELGNGKWATGKDTVLAFNDENNNFKPLPFSFSRASSGTIVNKDGLIETVGVGEPRIDFKDNTKGTLLLEPSRSNLVTYSEDFSNGVWNIGGATTIILDNLLSPDGEQSSYKQVENNTINSFSTRYSTSISYTSGLKYTTSIFAKSDNRNLMIRSYNGSSDIDTIFDLSNGTILSGSTGEIKDYGNGWYRCSHTITAQSTINTVYSASFVLANGSSYSYQGDGTSGVYIWGAQLEQGSYATSYIPTFGSAVTRVKDTCYNDNLANVIGQTEGTFYLETVPLNSLTSYTERVIQFESSGSGFMTIQRYANDNITFYGTNGSNNWSIQGTGLFVGGQTIKIAGAYKDNDITLYVNGIQIGTNTTANAPQTEKLRFANNTSGSLGYLGSHKDVKLYNTRLSNSELQALTTISQE